MIVLSLRHYTTYTIEHYKHIYKPVILLDLTNTPSQRQSMRKQEAGYNTNKRVVINGKPYQITGEMYRMMKYFEQSQAIEQTDTHQINTFTNQTWEKVLFILSENNYHLQLPPPNITSSNIQDYLQSRVIHYLGKCSNSELNDIYKASHYLKIVELRKAIGVFYACRVFFKHTKKEYAKKAQELGIGRKEYWPSDEQVSRYKDTFPFIN